ncbi:MAG: phosphonate C-P lyase system protein PhnH [Proteobacteria bacterium]|nr:phosphonate C-P lyase system protein PhnH [Pseudomonadota bacterium]
MGAYPIPSEFEARTNATYEALMWALSRPGLPRDLPSAGQAGIIETLIDRECAVYCEDADMAELAARSGAVLAAPEKADHLFLSQPPAQLTGLRQGSDMYPEEGATLVMPVSLGSGGTLRLSGPGVNGEVTLSLSGIPQGFWAERTRVMRYPMGFEVFLLDGATVIGIPRTTVVEVL